MFDYDFADTCPEKFPLMPMEGRAEGLAYANLVGRTPMAVSRIPVVFVPKSGSRDCNVSITDLFFKIGAL